MRNFNYTRNGLGLTGVIAVLALLAASNAVIAQSKNPYLGRYAGEVTVKNLGLVELGRADLVMEVTKFASSDGSVEGTVTLTFDDGKKRSGKFKGRAKSPVLFVASGKLTGDYDFTVVVNGIEQDELRGSMWWKKLAYGERTSIIQDMVLKRSSLDDLKEKCLRLKQQIEDLQKELERLKQMIHDMDQPKEEKPG
jgi:hypothetical protein